MLTSLQFGLAALPSGVEKVFVTPADVPLVSGETLEIMLGGGFFPCIPSAIAFVIVSLIAPDKAKA